jgi:hypothetical protein
MAIVMNRMALSARVGTPVVGQIAFGWYQTLSGTSASTVAVLFDTTTLQ